MKVQLSNSCRGINVWHCNCYSCANFQALWARIPASLARDRRQTLRHSTEIRLNFHEEYQQAGPYYYTFTFWLLRLSRRIISVHV